MRPQINTAWVRKNVLKAYISPVDMMLSLCDELDHCREREVRLRQAIDLHKVQHHHPPNNSITQSDRELWKVVER